MSLLVDIVPLPPMPDDRFGDLFRDPVHFSDQHPDHRFRYYHNDTWGGHGYTLPELNLGLPVRPDSHSYFKSVSISNCRKYVMETVFVQISRNRYVYLYGTFHDRHNRVVAISSSGIGELSNSSIACPVIHFINDGGSANMRSSRDMVLVPPIFTEREFEAYVGDMVESFKARGGYLPIDPPFDRIFHHFPKEALRLIEGLVPLGAFHDIHSVHPDYQKLGNAWSLYDELRFEDHVVGDHLRLTPPAFDDIVLEMICQFPQQFRLEGSISLAVRHSLFQISVTEIFDPYAVIVGRSVQDWIGVLGSSHDLLKRLVHTFARIEGLSLNDLSKDNTARFRIAASMRDELVLMFKWGHNQRAAFYTHIPSLMRSTKAVGWFS